MTASALILKQ